VDTSAIEVADESGEIFSNNTGLALNSGASWLGNLSQNAVTEIKIINEFQGSTPLVASTLLHEFVCIWQTSI
jgi:hypothetical protein